MDENQARIVRMRDIQLDESLFRNYLTGTVLDELLCSYKGLPKGVNYMVIGDPGVGKTTIILDMLADIISDTGSEQNIWGLEPELHH